jgi:2-polyprenyl-3-methyl-5-hydroxy-6-metoxy-1,4-benzoquinol methylase
LRRQRLKVAKPYLKGRILNVGCGSGALPELVDAGHYLGVEIDEVSLQQAQLRFPAHRFVSDLPEFTDKFDTIISLPVIEHVIDHAEFLRKRTVHLVD